MAIEMNRWVLIPSLSGYPALAEHATPPITCPRYPSSVACSLPSPVMNLEQPAQTNAMRALTQQASSYYQL